MNLLMNDNGVCRTAPATPGMLKIFKGRYDNTALQQPKVVFGRSYKKRTVKFF